MALDVLAVDVRALDERLRGRVLTPEHPEYDVARELYNGMFDARPALIAQCAATADVIEAIAFARAHDLELAVRAGGHSVAGNSMCEGGLVIDMRPLNWIEVDPERQIAVCGGGLNWGQVDDATQAHKLALTGGVVSSTGMAGFCLNGGIGWLHRNLGMSCDNLLAAEIVTADGEIVRTSADENPELLWALRGAGTNFGVVTEFTLQLHPIDMVLGGFLCYSIDRAREVYDFFVEYTRDMPNELCLMYMGLTTPPEDQFPEHVRGKIAIMLPFIWSGDRDTGDQILADLTAACPPDASSVSWLTYLRMQKWRDDGYGIWGWRNYWKSEFIDRADEDFFDVFLRYTKAMTSDRDQCHLITLGGQVSNEPAGGSAYANRDAPYCLHIIATWQDPVDDDQHFDWARSFAEEIQPFGRRATYLNFITNEGEERVRAAYGGDAAFERLVALKDLYDPENVFHRNQNILPSALRNG